MKRHYGTFYWPLALSGFVILLEQQFQNGVLAQYPHAEMELATFALASSSFQLVNAFLGFIPQLVAVMARTPADRAMCARFSNRAGLLLSLPLLLMGFTSQGQMVLSWWMNIPAEQMPSVVRYLQWLAPLVWINAGRQYYTGVLVLAERTRAVTWQNVAHLAVLVGVLFTGVHLGWAALHTLALATLLANILHFVLGFVVVRTVVIPGHNTHNTSTATWGGMLTFYWPMAVTSVLFAMTRPVLYAYINLTVGATAMIAALRVGFDFCAMFQNPINQFRHVYATYGADDPKGVTRFMVRVTALYVAIMCLVAFTPLSRLVFGTLMGLDGVVLSQTVVVVRVLLFVPILIMVRNLYHGKMMVQRKTMAMAVAALMRVGMVAVAAKGFLALGWLNAMTASLVVVAGFVAEVVVVRQSVKR